VSEPLPPDASLTRHEEELEVEKSSEQIGAVRARKKVETEKVEQRVPRDVEDADVERVPAAGEEDSGEIETLPDGSISVPLFEEQLVVTKRLVVRERIVIRKRTTTEIERIEATLRAEQIEIEEDLG
jgi:uncharacterized protein (TIGR02271 family)